MCDCETSGVFRYGCLVCIISALCARLPANLVLMKRFLSRPKKGFISQQHLHRCLQETSHLYAGGSSFYQ